jgi:hypothetical protein
MNFLHRHLYRSLPSRNSIAEPFRDIRKHPIASLRSHTYFPLEQLDQSVIFGDASSIYSALQLSDFGARGFEFDPLEFAHGERFRF